jgi:hypothetical protein
VRKGDFFLKKCGAFSQALASRAQNKSSMQVASGEQAAARDTMVTGTGNILLRQTPVIIIHQSVMLIPHKVTLQKVELTEMRMNIMTS